MTNSRRESEVFNLLFHARKALNDFPDIENEWNLIQELESIISNKKSQKEDKRTASVYLSKIKEKIDKLSLEIENQTDETNGSTISSDEYEEAIVANLKFENSITFHRVISLRNNKYEALYTLKSNAPKTYLLLMYAPERFMGSSRITKRTVINHLQLGGLGVQIANTFPKSISKDKTEIVSVLIDNLDFSLNYYFQLYAINQNGIIMSDPLRLISKKPGIVLEDENYLDSGSSNSVANDYHHKSEKELISEYLQERQKATNNFIQNIYNKRFENAAVDSVFDRLGSPSNNSRYDKGG